MRDLFEAIYNKFTESTGQGSLYASVNGQMYNTQAPQDAERPYIIFYLISTVPHWTFDANMENSLLQFTIYDENSSVENVCDLYEQLKDLYDDTELSSTGYYSVYMRREFSNLEQSSGIWTYSVQYRIELQEK